jgi:hypothetical protein
MSLAPSTSGKAATQEPFSSTFFPALRNSSLPRNALASECLAAHPHAPAPQSLRRV